MSQWGYLIMALAAGACLPLQVGVNSTLARGLANPVSAAMVSFAVGTMVLFAYVLAMRYPLPGLSRSAALPWSTSTCVETSHGTEIPISSQVRGILCFLLLS